MADPNFLQQLVQLVSPLLTGQQQSQAPAAPATIPTPAGPSTTSIIGPNGPVPPPPTAAPAAPPQSGGLEGLLKSPLAQGALSTYLGYLAAPRGNNWRRLGVAGLTGLQGFEAAEKGQAELPRAAAETRKTIADANMAEAGAKYIGENPQAAAYKFGGKYAEMQQAKLNNAGLAATWRDAAMQSHPQMAERINSVAQMVANSGVPVKPEELTKMLYGDQEAESKIRMQNALAGQVGQPTPTMITDPVTRLAMVARPGVYVPQGAEKVGAEPKLPHYEDFILDPTKPADAPGNRKTIDTTREAKPPGAVLYHPGAAGGTKPLTDAQIQAEATKRARVELGTVPAAGIGESLTGTHATASKKMQDRIAEIVQELKADRDASRGGGPTEADLADLPPGWKLDTKINSMTGHPDAIGPDGAHKPWTPD